MKEIREILNSVNDLQGSDTPVLATVVDVRGSSFRLPGAKMLILDDGMTVGTVSGGCLEADVLQRAAAVRESGEAAVLVYDTSKTDDSVFSLNMGCRGIVRILMEPARDSAVLTFYREHLKNPAAGVVATQIEGKRIGARVIVDSTGITHNSFDEPNLTQAVLAESDGVLKDKRSQVKKFGPAEVFFEYIPLPTTLLIFGAGADAVPLVELSHQLGWESHVIDHRPAYANAARFPKADVILTPTREELVEAAAIGAESVAVVMTHNVELDKRVLRDLLGSEIRYIGAMGPKSRTAEMLADIESSGTTITEEMREKVHGPVGLDIGATTPEGIALSIASEIQTFLSGREGGPLRDREGSIYGRS